MKFTFRKFTLPFGTLAVLWASVLHIQAQTPFEPPTTPMAQRNAMNLVVNQANLFQNATGSASSYAGLGYGLLVRQIQALRNQYGAFVSTLTLEQLASGASQLAELEAGLEMIEGAFSDSLTAVANGQSSNTASAHLRRVLNEAIRVWTQEFKQQTRQLQVGW